MKIEHTAMYVSDLEKSRTFFEKYFNAKSNNMYHNNKTGFSSYFLEFSEGARLEIMTKPEVTSSQNPNAYGYAHISFSVGTKEEVDKLTEILKADGYEVISGPRTTGDGYYESCVLDMDKNIIEITE